VSAWEGEEEEGGGNEREGGFEAYFTRGAVSRSVSSTRAEQRQFAYAFSRRLGLRVIFLFVCLGVD
jgi:hypothetical protein